MILILTNKFVKIQCFSIRRVSSPGPMACRQGPRVRRIRQVGAGRILYGSDAALGDNLRPREGWAAFRRLPLTESEFATISRNLAPYLR
jgi:hypothetical protein